MDFPQFDPERKKILFFSRGRGRGHAIPDLEIIRAIGKLRDDLDVRVVSYGTGAATFLEFGMPLIDLRLPEAGPIVELSVLAGKLIGWLNPDLVVSHEEFAAMPAAKIFDKPTLFLTDWFSEMEMYSMGALKFADQVLFLGARGVFDEPPWLSGKVQYVGAILRDFRYGPADRLHARVELGISEEALVISVFPGSWSETDAPILDTVVAAFDALDVQPRKLIWLAGADADRVLGRLAGRDDALVFEHCWEIDRLMVASDAAITKTNRKAVFELQHLRVPTVAISFGLNHADDRAVSALTSVVHLDGKAMDGVRLATEIRALLARPPAPANIPYCSVTRCAQLVSDALDRHGLLTTSPDPG